MKHNETLIFAFVLAAAILTATTGVVAAHGIQQDGPPIDSDSESNILGNGFWGPMNGMGWRWAEDGEAPPLRAAMIEALANETGLSEEEILSRFEAGEFFLEIALDAGLTKEDFFELRNSVRDKVFPEEFSGWRMGHPSRQRFERSPEQAENEGYFPPCHRLEENGVPAFGNPSRGRGRGW